MTQEQLPSYDVSALAEATVARATYKRGVKKALEEYNARPDSAKGPAEITLTIAPDVERALLALINGHNTLNNDTATLEDLAVHMITQHVGAIAALEEIPFTYPDTQEEEEI